MTCYARNLMEASLDPLVTINTEGKLTDVNQAAEALTGLPRGRLINSDFSGYFTDPERARAGYQRVLTEGSVRDYALTLRHVSGRTIDVLYNASLYHDERGEVVGVFATARNVTAQKRAERALRTLGAGNRALIRAQDEQELLNSICRVAVEAGGYRMGFVGFGPQDATRSVHVIACAGYDNGYTAAARISWGDNERGHGPTGTAIRTGILQVNQNFTVNPALGPWREAALKNGYQSSIALPLADKGCFGALTIYAAEPDAFDVDEVALLKDLAANLSYGISTLRTRSRAERSAAQLLKSMESTIDAIASTLEMRDPYTAGHQRRVAALASAIAEKMSLSDDVLKGLWMASTIHDIGKIKISADILSYPGRLGEHEMAIIKTHCQNGLDILETIDFDWPIAKAVFQHHERLDGSGYPKGLKGDEICLEAQIIGVADVVEAMMSHRPYRAGLGQEAALTEILNGRGTRYNASIVDLCVALFQGEGFAFPPSLR